MICPQAIGEETQAATESQVENSRKGTPAASPTEEPANGTPSVAVPSPTSPALSAPASSAGSTKDQVFRTNFSFVFELRFLHVLDCYV